MQDRAPSTKYGSNTALEEANSWWDMAKDSRISNFISFRLRMSISFDPIGLMNLAALPGMVPI